MARLGPSYAAGSLTNGRLVRALEEQTADRLGVREVVAVSSCTSGLMLAIRALGARVAGVLPSFTFCASAHSLAWNGVRPVFADCDPSTFQLDPTDAMRRLDGADILMGVHVFGAPCPVEKLEEIARAARIPLLLDSAHAFGARRRGRPVGGFGQAEVFSLSPTKPLIAGEGGLVATNEQDLAAHARLGRDYGNPGNYDTQFAGLNARMSEFHAAVALESLAQFDEHLELRRAAAKAYSTRLAAIPGLTPQVVEPGDESTYKDFTISVNEDRFGLTADAVASSLGREGIETRRYFSPPVHRQQAYSHLAMDQLPATDQAAGRALSLPMFPEITSQEIDRVCDALFLLHGRAAEARSLALQPST